MPPDAALSIRCDREPVPAYLVYSCFGSPHILWPGLLLNLTTAATTAAAAGALACFRRL